MISYENYIEVEVKDKMKKVREGYKMTELGQIPVDWEIRRLSEITLLIKDGTHNPPERTEKGIPLLSAENIFNNKINFGRNEKNISRKSFEDIHKSYNIEKNDVLLTCVGSIGRTAVVKDEPLFTVQRSVAIFKLCDSIDSYYFNYSLNSNYLQKQLKIRAKTTAQSGIYLGELSKMSTIVPKLSEQQKISLILSTVDESIENTDKLIDKTKELKKGLMQRLLTKGIGHDRFKNTEIGRIPEEWEVTQLNNVANVIDSLHETPKYQEEGFPMIRVVDVNGKAISAESSFKVSEDIYLKFTRKYKPQKYDIIMSRVGSYGIVSYLKDDKKVCLGQNIVVINAKINKMYLFYCLISIIVQSQIERFAVGSSQKTLSLENIKKLMVLLPNPEEQERITLILISVDEKIEQYESKKEKLLDLKKGLMQKLLTGKIRVKV